MQHPIYKLFNYKNLYGMKNLIRAIKDFFSIENGYVLLPSNI